MTVVISTFDGVFMQVMMHILYLHSSSLNLIFNVERNQLSHVGKVLCQVGVKQDNNIRCTSNV